MLLVTPSFRRRLVGALLLIAGSFPVAQARAQAAPTLSVTGLDARTRTLTAADLARLPRVEQTAKDKEGKKHQYSGVALASLLQLAGVPQGKELHGPALADALLVTAADGYKVVFALPELDAAFTSQTVLLADRRDGQPLPAGTGPYQIIVPQEKRPTRWVRQVTALRVVVVQP